MPRHRPPPARIPPCTRENTDPHDGHRARSCSSSPAASRWGAAFSTSTCTSSRADPMCSISRDGRPGVDPRRDECTICTAVALNASSPCAHTGTPGHSRTGISAQLQRSRTANPQVTTREVDKGQIVAERPRLLRSILGHADSRYNHSNKHKSCLGYPFNRSSLSRWSILERACITRGHGGVSGLVPHRRGLPGLPGVAALARRFRLPVLRYPGGLAAGRWPVECAGCSRRTSVTAGTIFDRTRTPLTVWFTACWLFATQKDGISALSLQRTLEIGSYQTAWAMLHRLRSVLVRPGRERLCGKVEVDETYHRRRRAGPARRPGQGQEGAHRYRGRGQGAEGDRPLPDGGPGGRVLGLAASLRHR